MAALLNNVFSAKKGLIVLNFTQNNDEYIEYKRKRNLAIKCEKVCITGLN